MPAGGETGIRKVKLQEKVRFEQQNWVYVVIHVWFCSYLIVSVFIVYIYIYDYTHCIIYAIGRCICLHIQ